MSVLQISRISKSFGNIMAVNDVSLVAGRGDLVCLLGPSGSGKTTLLRIIAGLEYPDSGSITFDSRPVDGLPPQARGFGLMFQDLALFPHMDVHSNISFGLRMQRRPKAEIARRVDELLELVDMPGFSRRKVQDLSGGERQRVALARSLAPEPPLLMLDEPLGSLDRGLREALQIQIRSVLKDVGVTALYVTHDRNEAFALADAMLIMDRGEIVQAGSPEDLFQAPNSKLVARTLGIKNVLPGTLIKDEGETMIGCAVGTFIPDTPIANTPAGGKILVIIDERRMLIGKNKGLVPQAATEIEGTVVNQRFHAGETEIVVCAGKGTLEILLPRGNRIPRAGEPVTIVVPQDAVRFVASQA